MNKRESNRNIQRHKYTSSLHYPSYFCPLVKEELWWCVGGNVDRSGHDWLIKNQTVGRQEEVLAHAIHACALCASYRPNWYFISNIPLIHIYVPQTNITPLRPVLSLNVLYSSTWVTNPTMTVLPGQCFNSSQLSSSSSCSVCRRTSLRWRL